MKFPKASLKASQEREERQDQQNQGSLSGWQVLQNHHCPAHSGGFSCRLLQACCRPSAAVNLQGLASLAHGSQTSLPPARSWPQALCSLRDAIGAVPGLNNVGQRGTRPFPRSLPWVPVITPPSVLLLSCLCLLVLLLLLLLLPARRASASSSRQSCCFCCCCRRCHCCCFQLILGFSVVTFEALQLHNCPLLAQIHTLLRPPFPA